MMVDEFDDFCTLSGVLNDLMTAPIISNFFNLSIFTQEDEVKTNSHMRASLVEFVEMICRIANEGSYPPPPKIDEYGDEIESDMTIEERKAQPLQEKMKNMIPILLDHVCDRTFVRKWESYPLVYHADQGLYYLESGTYF